MLLGGVVSVDRVSGVGAYVARIDHALGQGQGLYPAPASGPLHPPTDLPPTPPPPPGTSATATGASTAAAGYQGQWNTGTALDEHTTTNATAGRAEAQAGRGGATAVRATAATQAAAIAPATSSPAGVKLLVTAMDDKLAAMQRQLSTTQDQNRLLATRMRQLAAAYTRIGGTMTPTSPTTPTNSMTPLLGAGPAMTNSLGSLSQLGSGAGSAVAGLKSLLPQMVTPASGATGDAVRVVDIAGRSGDRPAFRERSPQFGCCSQGGAVRAHEVGPALHLGCGWSACL